MPGSCIPWVTASLNPALKSPDPTGNHRSPSKSTRQTPGHGCLQRGLRNTETLVQSPSGQEAPFSMALALSPWLPAPARFEASSAHAGQLRPPATRPSPSLPQPRAPVSACSWSRAPAASFLGCLSPTAQHTHSGVCFNPQIPEGILTVYPSLGLLEPLFHGALFFKSFPIFLLIPRKCKVFPKAPVMADSWPEAEEGY